MLNISLERPLASRILTTIEMLSQQSTAERPELEALREAIKTAFADAIPAPENDREPLERAFFP